MDGPLQKIASTARSNSRGARQGPVPAIARTVGERTVPLHHLRLSCRIQSAHLKIPAGQHSPERIDVNDAAVVADLRLVLADFDQVRAEMDATIAERSGVSALASSSAKTALDDVMQMNDDGIGSRLLRCSAAQTLFRRYLSRWVCGAK